MLNWVDFIPNDSKSRESAIARFDPIQNSWSKLGNLNVARSSHGVIQVNNEIIVVGGTSGCLGCGFVDVPTESCKLNGQSMKCVTREPELWNFAYFPELMLVSWFYICKNLLQSRARVFLCKNSKKVGKLRASRKIMWTFLNLFQLAKILE